MYSISPLLGIRVFIYYVLAHTYCNFVHSCDNIIETSDRFGSLIKIRLDVPHVNFCRRSLLLDVEHNA